MSTKSQKALAWLKDGLSLLAVASIFIAEYFIRSDPSENNIPATLLVYAVNSIVVVGLALFSFYRKVNLRALFLLLLGVVILRYALPTGQTGLTVVLIKVITGIMYGLNVSAMAGILALASRGYVRRIIFLGACAAALILPLLHMGTALSDAAIQQLLFFVATGSIGLFLLFEKPSEAIFSPAKETIGKYRGTSKQWVKVLFTQRKSTLLTLIMTVPFFFCLGIFDAYSFDRGFSFATSDTIMLGTAAVILALCIADVFRPTNTWFGMVSFVVGALYMTIIFSTLVVADFPPYLFGIMRAGIIIMQIQILIFLSETILEESLSPTFLYGALAFIVIAPIIAGNIVALLLRGLESSILVGGALMAIAVVAGAIVVLLIRGSSSIPREKEEPERSSGQEPQDGKAFEQAAESLAAFCEHYGLSDKEREVIRLYSQGRSVRHISAKLYISESTARTYIQRVYAKLDVHNKQELLDLIDDNANA